MESAILTIKQLSEYLKVNQRTVYRLANKGEIPAFKVGNNWRFKATAIEDWIQKSTDKTRDEGGQG